MWKKLILGILIAGIAGSSLLWIFRIEVLLYVSSLRNKVTVAEHREVVWQRGQSVSINKPNVVLILMDDMGINDVSTFGGGMIETPNIDRLAAQGALFSNGYAAHANCAPSRAALLTGRDSSRTGFDITPIPSGMGRAIALITNKRARGLPKVEYFPEADNSNPEFDDRGLPGSEITIAELMKNAGYRTLHIGKWHLGRAHDMMPNQQGFDESLMMASGLYLPVDHPDAVNAPIEYSGLDRFIWHNMEYAVSWNSNDWFRPKGYLTDYFTAEAEKAIEANANRPFFLYLAHWGPHNPIQAQRSDFEAVGDIQPHQKRVYAAMLRSLDRSVGKVMAKLEEQGIADKTIILLSSDNGGADYVAIEDLNAPYRGWKSTFFEGGIRVPFSITWPDKIQAGIRIDEPVVHYDLMPTIASAAGISLPTDRTIDGKDLSVLWDGSKNELKRENGGIFWSTGNYKTVLSNGWKLQLNPASNQQFLFNTQIDPTETSNLAKTEPEKLKQLTALIHQHYQNATPPLAQPVVLGPIAIDKTIKDKVSADDTYIIWSN